MSRSLPELGYEKDKGTVNANSRFPIHSDFFIILGVELYGYAKIDGYITVFLEQLQGNEAILWQPHRES
ncbi:hypothetical protein DSM106972_048630 [Dulcicalothrix desertica PCC 7102]|uniref:Uncharacterized protein n=1 Tax=Dulcicalothrix desertica PCC 7102 TaxID=232991 RepID=A0A3S1CLF1_9CYAN|nr:hypothetical protein [Dulcicalothrix desertica]RUT03949.1 hypothetical protein DSM106972_048630 [Dulcicalothrix desertica PCC 7102]TWH43646.1 hypothetical protein CAL7102_07386 [Dulcicalothrix desertica PCC 7102]